MSEVLRDVVIRIGLQQLQATLTAPDTSAATEAVKTFEESAKTSAAAAGEAFEKSFSTGGLEESIATLDDLFREHEEAIARTNEILDELDKKQEQAARSQEALRTNSLKALDSFQKVGEGVFKLARGIAFLTASSDEDFRKTLVTIAKVQGGFDLFKGSFDILRGLSEGIRAVQTVSAAATTINTALAVSNTAVATTSLTAAGGLAAMQIALGPIGWAFLGLAAGVAILSSIAADAHEADEALQGLADSTRKAAEEQERLTASSLAWIEQEGKLRDIETAASDRVSALKDEATQLEDIANRRETLVQLAEKAQKGESANTFRGGTTGGIDNAKVASAAAAAAADAAEKEAKSWDRIRDGVEKKSDLEKDMNNVLKIGIDKRAMHVNAVLVELAFTNELLSAKRQIVSDEERAFQLIKKRQEEELQGREKAIQAAEREADLQERSLRTIEEKVRKEQERVTTLDEALGRLDKGELREVERILGKAKEGKASGGELEFLEKMVGAGAVKEFTGKEFAEKGRERREGFGVDLGFLLGGESVDGQGSVLESLKQQEEAARRNLEQQRDSIDMQRSYVEELKESNARANEQTIAVIQEAVEVAAGVEAAATALVGRLDSLKRRVDELQQRVRQGGD